MSEHEVTANEADPGVGENVTRDMLNKLDHGALVLFGRLNYGFDNVTTQTHGKEELTEMIMNAARKFKGNAEMRVVEKNEKVRVPKGYVKIRVSPGDHNPNNRPVPLGLNFKMATIPVNKDVIMHEKWLPCLEDAVQTKYYLDKTDPTGTKLGMMEQQSYPFSILERG